MSGRLDGRRAKLGGGRRDTRVFRRGGAGSGWLAAIVVLGAGLTGLGEPSSAYAQVRLPAILSDGVVLQREANVTLWGWASPGEAVRITPTWPGAAAVTAQADDEGAWSATLTTPGAGGPFEVVFAGSTEVTLRDVLLGDVWICGGQSNMEWTVSRSQNPAGEIQAANFPLIRSFDVPNVASARVEKNTGGSWKAATPLNVGDFSAVGYFFAREIHRKHGVPIGLIASNWGGTVAEAWMSAESLGAFPTFAPALEGLRLEASTDAQDVAARQAERMKRMVSAWWTGLDRQGDAPADWAAPAFDDEAWKAMNLPATLRADGLDRFDGVIYFRRVVDVPESGAGKPAVLELGPIDDRDEAFVNGVSVGSTYEDGRWGQSRSYQVPAGLLAAGRNVVAIRMLDTAGLGGVNGKPEQMRLVLQANGEGGQAISLSGAWKYRLGKASPQLPPMPDPTKLNPNTPSVLYNAMIAPIARTAVRGTLWYQGESNRATAGLYASLFPALIDDWRRAFNQPEMPFYFVQIAPFNYPNDTGQTALVREAQFATLDRRKHTGMVVTTDIGDVNDIHPRNKQEVGRRLSLLARAGTYGERDVVSMGPVCRHVSIEHGTDGNPGRARLHFRNVGEGLVARGNDRGELTHFLIAGSDKQFYKARARIEGETVLVSSPRVPKPEAVRFAFENAPEPNFFNHAGLPAAPFRTDNWDEPLPPVMDDGQTSYLTTEPGFIDLFNGENLEGWVNVNCAPATIENNLGTWTVRDGVIHCTGFPTGLLRTAKRYENFILEVEWRHLQPKGNAGIFVWSDALPVRGQPFTRSIEVQVMDGLEGDWFTSDGDIFPIHGATMTPENPRPKGGSRAFPTEKRMKPAPEWNHYRIECVDGAISLAVNGKVVTQGKNADPRVGYICLESEGSPIQFRNVRIKELPGTLPTQTTMDAIAVAQEGFVPLYTGVDLAGWKADPKNEGNWTPQDWVLDYNGKGNHLWSEKSFKDFILICDWRWSGPVNDAERPVILPDGSEQKDADGKTVTRTIKNAGDSGIYLRGSEKSQVNIWCWPAGSGEVYGYRTDASMPAEVRAGVTPRVVADAPIGQWNRFIITMKGDRLSVVLNGKSVIENAQLPGVPERGPIALQNHGDPIQFANILIKELD
ncbi:MAG: family 16 glycoside hydrolase [Planctomycetota bacterium]|nr:family 16 glycoside hydrolase [Planctomycetota bacterium]